MSSIRRLHAAISSLGSLSGGRIARALPAGRRGAVVALAGISLALVSGCSTSSEPGEDIGITTQYRIVNASPATLLYALDQQGKLNQLDVGGTSNVLTTSAGVHQLRLMAANDATTLLSFEPTPIHALTVIVSGTFNGVSGTVLADTGATVPSGKSKLRVSNFSQNSNIEIWRTQPDFQTPVHILTPFAYQATSPYLQSDPGNWEVFVTATGSTTKLATTGSINVPSGERRTVVLLDSAGVMRLRVLPD